MAEQDTTANPQAGAASDTQPQPQAGNPDPQAGDGLNEPISLADAKKLRSENSNLRTRMKEQETLLAELKVFKEQAEASQLSDTEKRDRISQQREKQFADLQKAYEEHTQATFERITNLEIRAQAATLGINPKHLDKVARFIEWENIEPDDNGNPVGIKEALEKLIKDMPELLGKGSASSTHVSSGATNPPRSQVETGEITATYVADVMNGKIPWQSLTPDRRTAVLNWQAKNAYRF